VLPEPAHQPADTDTPCAGISPEEGQWKDLQAVPVFAMATTPILGVLSPVVEESHIRGS
jgi:hypothetical protein